MKEVETGGHVARMVEVRSAYTLLDRKPGAYSRGRPRRRWGK